MQITIEDIRKVIREELDATIGLGEDVAEPTVTDSRWMFHTTDGVFNVKALYSDNQMAMIESGRNVALSPQVLAIFHRAALAVKSGPRQIADNASGERLRQYMADNPQHYG